MNIFCLTDDAYLGFDITIDRKDEITMKQSSLIQKILDALGHYIKDSKQSQLLLCQKQTSHKTENWPEIIIEKL